ncbi:MAG: ATP-binding protein [Kangiellaceae bacterium]
MKLKIKYKLFFAMLLANILVIIGIYFLFSLSFNSSFKDYLDAHQENKLQPLVSALEEGYRENGHWDWLRPPNQRVWRELLAENLFPSLGIETAGEFERPFRPNSKRRKPPPKFNSDEDEYRTKGDTKRKGVNRRERLARREKDRGRHPPPRPVLNIREGLTQKNFEIDPRIFLLNADEDKSIIIGPDAVKELEVNWLDLKVENETVGYLGYRRTQEVTSDLDQLFVSKLKENLSWSFILVIFVSAIVTVELARRLVQPILRLRKATNSIASGDYNTRLDIRSQDEFGELAKDFSRLSKTLSNNLTARQQWIADISHELRTPVAILRAELEAIQDGVRPLAIETVDSLHQEILRLTRLINDLHELSLSDSGALTYQYRHLEISSLILDLIDSEQSIIKKHKFDVKVNKNDKVEKLKVFADHDRLTQLFSNLLNNSLVYSDENGVIEVDFECTKQQIIIIWKDSKPAVKDEQLHKLFDRLYRVDASRNRNTGGSGLGLSICKNIVQAHNGHITAQHSDIGGVQFTISLPISKKV